MIITQLSFNIRENPFKYIWLGELAVGLETFFVEIFQISANLYIFPYINTIDGTYRGFCNSLDILIKGI